MNCPVCNVELRMGDRLGIELDYCPQCRGIWLEKGKLDRILEKSAGARPEQAVDPGPSYGHRDEHGYEHDRGHYGRHGKKRGFFADLFD